MNPQDLRAELASVVGQLRADIDTMQDVYLTTEQRAAFDRIVAVASEHGGGGEAEPERVAQLIAHRACHSAEHDPENGKLHGYCIVCGVPWPCAYAGTPPTPRAPVGVDLDKVAAHLAEHGGDFDALIRLVQEAALTPPAAAPTQEKGNG